MRAERERGARWVSGLLLLGLGLGLCAGCYDTRENVGGDSHFLRPCERQEQCDDLGEGFTCEGGYCQPPSVTTAVDASAPEADAVVKSDSVQGSDAAPASVSSSAPEPVMPLALLLIDTSGSMERTMGCVCPDLSCKECLPQCATDRGDFEKNRWTHLLEALTGSFRDFSCRAWERTLDGGATYDVGYYLPYHQPLGEQEGDGVLDLYRDRVRFGVATFDAIDTYVGSPRLVPSEQFDPQRSVAQAGQWSYNPALEIRDALHGADWPIGLFKYPNCTTHYLMDTGIRNRLAPEGALRVADDPARAAEVNDAIQLDLAKVRPYGGTPIAASLDDLYYVLKQDPFMESERQRGAPRHVVLITDGEPDADYRDLGCDCADDGDDPDRCGDPLTNDPAEMHCPYPTAEQGARALRCGKYIVGCDGPATALHVIGLNVGGDESITEQLDLLAAAGGTERARMAADVAELRTVLMEVLDAIAP